MLEDILSEYPAAPKVIDQETVTEISVTVLDQTQLRLELETIVAMFDHDNVPIRRHIQSGAKGVLVWISFAHIERLREMLKG